MGDQVDSCTADRLNPYTLFQHLKAIKTLNVIIVA